MVIDFKAIREKASQPAAPVGGVQFTPVCACQAVREYYDTGIGGMFEDKVRLCPFHAAAPAMYAVIKDMREAFYVKGTRKALLEVMERSKDVIAQAEGRQG